MATLSENMVLLETLQAKAKAKEAAKRDEFIRARTQWENVIDSFREGVKEADPELMELVQLPPEITCPALMPSLYKDSFVMEDFLREKQAFDEIRLAVGRILKGLVEEAITSTEAYLNE